MMRLAIKPSQTPDRTGILRKRLAKANAVLNASLPLTPLRANDLEQFHDMGR